MGGGRAKHNDYRDYASCRRASLYTHKQRTNSPAKPSSAATARQKESKPSQQKPQPRQPNANASHQPHAFSQPSAEA